MRDLIAAVSTGSARCAIGILRLSGEGALAAADKVFVPAAGLPMSQRPDRKLVYGSVRGPEGQTLDFGLCTVSRAPNSYTGEDTAELQLHGSPIVLSEVLGLLFSVGARQALPGEFSKRAFLNGRLDLTEAEAVMDLIDAETPEAARTAADQLGGSIFRAANEIWERLTDLQSHLQAVIDWPEEDVPELEMAEYARRLRQGQTELEKLAASFERGKLLRQGARCVLTGKPNAGKSSLMNALAGYQRAIVTAEAGTTRDTVEEKVRLGGVLLRLTDTAGLREAESEAEKLGVERALEAARGAELVLAVFDGSLPPEAEDEEVLLAARGSARRIPVVNKTDRPLAAETVALARGLGEPVFVSCVTGEGVAELIERIRALFPTECEEAGTAVLTNARQAGAVSKAVEELGKAAEAAENGLTPDAVGLMVDAAMEALGLLTGRTADAEIAEKVFSRFCVGK